MEPTIYKPSIYKGAGIYKTGAEGGGGNVNLYDFFEVVDNIYMNDMYNAYPPYQLAETVNNDDFLLEASIFIPNTSINDSATFVVMNTYNSYSQLVYLSCPGTVNPRTIRYSNNYKSNDITTPNLSQNVEFKIDAPINAKWNNNSLTISNPDLINLSYIWPLQTKTGNAQGNLMKAGLKGMTITKKSTNKVICQFVPVKRKIDNVVGLFEFVKGVFYTSNYFGYR